MGLDMAKISRSQEKQKQKLSKMWKVLKETSVFMGTDTFKVIMKVLIMI